jgi:16S rRNA processing protein RimM
LTPPQAPANTPGPKEGGAARETGSPPFSSAPRYLAVARILTSFGVHGELRAEILTEFPERFAGLQTVYLSEEAQPYSLESSRLQRGQVILKLQGIDTPEQAAKLRGQLVQVPVEEAVALPEGQYYLYQIVGLAVETTAGEPLGHVTDVLFTGANDVYVVRGERGELLVPAIEQVVKQVDLEHGRLIIEPLQGM